MRWPGRPGMLAVAVLGWLAVGLRAEGGFRCPKADGDFRNPGELCSGVYFTCRGNKAVRQRCRPGTVFNSILGSCDAPGKVFGCGRREGGCGEAEVMEECGTACPATCGTPEPRACPLQCVRGCQCRRGLLRDRFGLCVAPEDCEARKTVQDPTPAPAQAFVCPKGAAGKFSGRQWEACGRSYVECGPEGERKTGLCDEGEVFEEHSGACVPQAQSKLCAFSCQGRPNGMYAEGCSEHFWWCWEGLGTRQRCVEGTFFAEDLGECTFSADVPECSGRPAKPRPTPAPRDVTPKPKMDCKEMPDGDFADPEGGCVEHFFVCSNGYAFRRRCPPGLAFDATRKICDYKDRIADCGGSQAEAQSPRTYVCPQPKGDFADPLRPCTGYYWWCMDSKPMYTRCSGNMIFNPASGLCDRRRNVLGCNGVHASQASVFGSRRDRLLQPPTGHLVQLPQPQAQVSQPLPRPQPRPQAFPQPFPQLPMVENTKPIVLVIHTNPQPTIRSGPPVVVSRQPQMESGPRVYQPQAQYTRFVDAPPLPRPYAQHSGPRYQTNNFRQAQDIGHSFPRHSGPRHSGARHSGPRHSGPRNSGPRYQSSYRESELRHSGPRHSGPRVQIRNPPVTRAPLTTPAPFCLEGSTVALGLCSSAYLHCYAGELQSGDCGYGNVFSQRHQTCVPSLQLSECRPPTPATTLPPTTTGAPVTRAQPPSTTPAPLCLDGSTVALGPCLSAFLRCSAGRLVDADCGPGHIFSRRLLKCLRSSQEPECRTAAPPATTSTAAPLCVEGSTVALAPCSADYLQCASGRLEGQKCVYGQVFAEAQLACVPADLVSQCRVESPPVTQAPTSPPTTYYAPPPSTPAPAPVTLETPVKVVFCEEGETVALGPCATEYLRCVDGRLKEALCRQGDVFSEQGQRCLAAGEEPECLVQSPPVTAPPPTPSAPATTPATNHCEDQPDGTLLAFGPCSKDYCECQAAKPIFRTCQPGQVFQTSAQLCSSVFDVAECAPSTTPFPTTTTAPMSHNHCADEADGTLIAFGECGKDYCECQSGKPIFRTCEIGEVFQTSSQTCSSVFDVPECAPLTTTTTPAPMGHNHCAAETDGTLIAFGACGKDYCECQGGKPIFRTCEVGEVFETASRQCTAVLEVAECAPVPLGDVPEPAGHCEGQADGTLIAFGHCGKDYCECQDDKPIFRTCEPGEVFDTASRLCQGLLSVEVCRPTTTSTTPDPSNHCALERDGTLIAFGACGKDYCECQGGKPLFRTCEVGEVFETGQRRCSSVFEVAECRPSTTTTTSTTTTADPSNHCAEETDGTLVAFGACGRDFCECLGGKPILRTCEAGEVFDTADRVCRSVFAVAECAPAPVEDVPRPRALSSKNYCAGQADGTVVAFGACERHFAECDCEEPLFRSCEAGQVFDTKLRACQSLHAVPECLPPLPIVQDAPDRCADKRHRSPQSSSSSSYSSS